MTKPTIIPAPTIEAVYADFLEKTGAKHDGEIKSVFVSGAAGALLAVALLLKFAGKPFSPEIRALFNEIAEINEQRKAELDAGGLQ